jgi:hypothetical protein
VLFVARRASAPRQKLFTLVLGWSVVSGLTPDVPWDC